MNWQFEFIDHNRLLRVQVEGHFMLDEQVEMFRKIALLDNWNPGVPILFDNRRLILGNQQTSSIRKAADLVNRFTSDYPGAKIAGLVNERINFGFERQFEIFTEILGNTQFHIFKDEYEAIKWLLKLPN